MKHIDKKYPGSFSARYNLSKLVYYELYHSIAKAISREKQIKAGSKAKKVKLIEEMNPVWEDLGEEVLKW